MNEKQKKNFRHYIEVFCENHLPKRHIKYSAIKFAPSNKPINEQKFWTICKTDLFSAYALVARNSSQNNC